MNEIVWNHFKGPQKRYLSRAKFISTCTPGSYIDMEECLISNAVRSPAIAKVNSTHHVHSPVTFWHLHFVTFWRLDTLPVSTDFD